MGRTKQTPFTEQAANGMRQHDSGMQKQIVKASAGKAVLQYENEGHNTMNMYHTGVPTEYRGQGIAGHLAKAALDYAVNQDAKVKLTCTYLQKYVKDHPSPEYTSCVV